jgi:NADH:ubiquinone oxidoreductase subunit 5 (subunit L)/multisubunit Na+/H+ antiporter MnhA subunit
MILNRIGDFSLLISIFLIFVNFKALDYSTVAALSLFLKTSSIQFFTFKFDSLTIIGIFMFVGAVGKSAQLGLHT